MRWVVARRPFRCSDVGSREILCSTRWPAKYPNQSGALGRVVVPRKTLDALQAVSGMVPPGVDGIEDTRLRVVREIAHVDDEIRDSCLKKALAISMCPGVQNQMSAIAQVSPSSRAFNTSAKCRLWSIACVLSSDRAW